MRNLIQAYLNIGIVPLIILALILGTFVGWALPDTAIGFGILGSMFIGALKAVAPILVFCLVLAAITGYQSNKKIYIKPVLMLYLIGTFIAALTAVIVSFIFPTEIVGLSQQVVQQQTAPKNLTRSFDQSDDEFG